MWFKARVVQGTFHKIASECLFSFERSNESVRIQIYSTLFLLYQMQTKKL